MSQFTPNNDSNGFTRKNLTGNITALVVLMLAVLAMVVVVVAFPKDNPVLQTTPTPAAQSETMEPCETLEPVVEPPVVKIDGIVIMGGIIVLITLAAVLRELFFYRNHL